MAIGNTAQGYHSSVVSDVFTHREKVDHIYANPKQKQM